MEVSQVQNHSHHSMNGLRSVVVSWKMQDMKVLVNQKLIAFNIGGDIDTENMKMFYETIYELKPEQWIRKKYITRNSHRKIR